MAADDNDQHTVATLPLTHTLDLLNRSLSPEVPPTQPTQPPNRHVRISPIPNIEVEASSPLRASPQRGPSIPPIPRGAFSRGILANLMAPPGTQFKPPILQANQDDPRDARSQTIEFTDDEADFSSDEDDRSTAIKASHWTKGGMPLSQINGGSGSVSRVEESPRGPSKPFNISQFIHKEAPKPIKKLADDMTSDYLYKEAPNRIKRSADEMASGYITSRPIKQQKQNVPAKAINVDGDSMTLGDVADYDVREKIKALQRIYPQLTVVEAREALMKKQGHIQDAQDLVSVWMEELDREQERKRKAVDLTQSDDELSSQNPLEPSVKRTVTAKGTIANKWSSTLAPNANPQYRVPQAPMMRPVASPVKPKKRLIRPRPPSPPPNSSQPSSPVKLPPLQPLQGGRSAKSLLESEDEAIEIDSSDDSNDGPVQFRSPLETTLLQFLNEGSRVDMLDVSAQPPSSVDLVLTNRPFRNLEAVRSLAEETVTTRRGKQGTRQKLVGDRLVKACLEMFTGYNAVDELVHECESLGRPITSEIQTWGISNFGKSEELDIVDLDIASHDSGIGTPNSFVDGDTQHSSSRGERLLRKPELMSTNFTLKDYQVVGLNWLSLLFKRKLSCILADDMGLGKTLQTIAFLAHLYEIGVKGPHLICVPGSTLENWLREFHVFCPRLRVEPYYGDQKERAEQRYSIEQTLDDINIIVTTYDVATKKDDAKFLRHLDNLTVCVYDEGHMLKNSSSDRYRQLMRFPAKFRLLLTGTPLQNNLKELVSLLAFIMPDVFNARREDLEYVFRHKAKTNDDHTALLSKRRIDRAKSMIKPFILRRKKHQVLKHLPAKTRREEICEMTPVQTALYVEQKARFLEGGLASLPISAPTSAPASAPTSEPASEAESNGQKSNLKSESKLTQNIMMDLRKAAIHPMLFRRQYTDAKLKEMAIVYVSNPEFVDRNVDLVYEDMTVMSDFELHRFCSASPNPKLKKFSLKNDPWLDSGKVRALIALLKKFIAAGDRTLVFSQFTLVMDILERVLQTHRITYSRLDGQTKMAERQDLIDQFYADTTISVFMLSTKAGGAGINLAAANKVIIFDSSFNPQDDVQAENRAHRVGQKREVDVVRLVSRGTIEEQIIKLGESKLVLDRRVAGEEDGNASEVSDGKRGRELERKGAEMVRSMLAARLDDESQRAGAATTSSPRGDEKVGIAGADEQVNGPLKPQPQRRSPRKSQEAETDVKDEFMKKLRQAGVNVTDQ